MAARIISVPDKPPVIHDPHAVFDNSPTFQMACRQLDAVAEVVEIDKQAVAIDNDVMKVGLVVARSVDYHSHC